MARYHVAVIGSGPGGYVAAIRAAQLGYSTAIIERERLGGVCLNWGCIPTKSLLESAHRLEDMRRAADFGLRVNGDVAPDFAAVIERSRRIAEEMSRGVEFLMKKNKITVIPGTARFSGNFKVEVRKADESEPQIVEADRFIVATGARSRSLPGMETDGRKIVGYREAMLQEKIPASLCVVGAGAIGVEFADFYASMGSRVTLLEALPHILPIEDEEVAKVLARSFQKREIKIATGVRVQSAQVKGEVVNVAYQDAKGATQNEQFDLVLSAVGIAANTEQLGLEDLGVRMSRDRVVVNDRYQTSIANIYAIGDCIPGPALAHVASIEGVRAAEAIYAASKKPAQSNGVADFEPVNYDLIPSCTYCHPEVASVGITEKKALEKGLEVKIGRFPFTASGRAKAMGDTTGFVKIIADKRFGQILGAHIIGPGATELISEITLGATLELLPENFARTVHAHPTLAEAVMEAAGDVLGEALNI